jgi:type IV fimbrial biogenesis protein FimT
MRSYQLGASWRGFNLVELMTAVAIASVLAGIAVPSFAQLIERQHFVGTQHQLMASFHLARSLALQTRRPAIVCPSSDGSSCRGGGVWDAGWLVFVDANNNRLRDAGEAVVRYERLDGESLRVRSSASRPQAVFRPNGGSGASNLSLRMCAPDGRVLGGLVLNNTGRLRKEPHPSGACR